MKKYVGICCEDESSRPMEIETSIPEEIVDQVEIALNKLDNKNWKISSAMTDPQSLNIIFELVEKVPNGYGSRYKIVLLPE